MIRRVKTGGGITTFATTLNIIGWQAIYSSSSSKSDSSKMARTLSGVNDQQQKLVDLCGRGNDEADNLEKSRERIMMTITKS